MQPAYRASAQPPEVVHDHEYNALMRAYPGPSKRDCRVRLVLALMYHAGLRSGEVRNLRRDQVVLDEDHPRLEVRGSKYGKGRNIPLDPQLVQHLHAWYTVGPASEYVVSTYLPPRPSDVIGSGQPPGSQLSAGVVWDIVKRACRKAGVRRSIRPHMFRHAAATRWLNSQAFTLRDVQILLGHSRPTVTQRYLHVSDTELAEKMERFGRIFDQDPTTMPCPYCEHRIKRDAVVCRYCREDLAG